MRAETFSAQFLYDSGVGSNDVPHPHDLVAFGF
jgi:hypothetical protein